uniref:Uncharacterized protein n=1 Tax=Anopheles epiroticus TaxID=199890 RepID=A0A182PES3_9DIPT
MKEKVFCVLIASFNLLAMVYTVTARNLHITMSGQYGASRTKEISLIRLFQMFLYAQLVFALMMVVYGYRFFDTVNVPILVKLYFSIMFIVCATELIIVSYTIDALNKKQNTAEGLVVYMPVGEAA